MAQEPNQSGLTCTMCGCSFAQEPSRRAIIAKSHGNMAKQDDLVLCDLCVAILERLRRESSERSSTPPIQTPSYRYPLGGTPPFVHRLLRVIPLAQTYRKGAFELTVVSLEVYEDSCLMPLWVQAVPKDVDIKFIQPQTHLTVQIRDDLGTVYVGESGPRTGGIGAGYYYQRAEYRFSPTLNPAAQALHVDVPELRWEYFEQDHRNPIVPGKRLWGDVDATWSFTVLLGTKPGE